MQKYFVLIRMFILGILCAFLVNLAASCGDADVTNPKIDEPAVETLQMQELSNKVIGAFESGKKENVLSLMYDEFKFIYDDWEADAEDMKKFAEAIKNRKITVSSSMYAEYEIIVNGKTYTIAYSLPSDGNWILHRF